MNLVELTRRDIPAHTSGRPTPAAVLTAVCVNRAHVVCLTVKRADIVEVRLTTGLSFEISGHVEHVVAQLAPESWHNSRQK